MAEGKGSGPDDAAQCRRVPNRAVTCADAGSAMLRDAARCARLPDFLWTFFGAQAASDACTHRFAVDNGTPVSALIAAKLWP